MKHLLERELPSGTFLCGDIAFEPRQVRQKIPPQSVEITGTIGSGTAECETLVPLRCMDFVVGPDPEDLPVEDDLEIEGSLFARDSRSAEFYLYGCHI